MAEYKIRELCGDWALDIPMGTDIVVLYFNSRVNAEMVKNVLEWENAHPNEAIPYNTPTIDPESLRPTAHWVHKQTKLPGGSLPVEECSLCECQTWSKTNFCPNCGAKMEDKSDGKSD